MGAFVPLWCGSKGEQANGSCRAFLVASRGACALVVGALGVVCGCGLIFRLVWALRGVGRVLVWGLVALRLVGRLNGLWLWCLASVLRCYDALTVGEGARVHPPY